MRRQLLIPHEKVPVIIKFKPSTFIFPLPQNTVPPKNNHPPSNSGLSSFLPRKNLFSLSKTTSFGFEKGKRTHFDLKKGNIFTLPPLFSFFFLQVVTTVEDVAAEDSVACPTTVVANNDSAARLTAAATKDRCTSKVFGSLLKIVVVVIIDQSLLIVVAAHPTDGAAASEIVDGCSLRADDTALLPHATTGMYFY